MLTNDSLVDFKQQFSIQAMDKQTGAVLWSSTECRNSPSLWILLFTVVTDNAVYFGWGEGKMYCCDPQTGKVIWNDSLDGPIISSPRNRRWQPLRCYHGRTLVTYKLSGTPPAQDFQQSTYCFPNPARGSVSHIQIFVTQTAKLSLKVYTTAEKPVFHFEHDLQPGKYVHDWSLTKVANGVYFTLVKVNYADGSEENKVLKIAVLK